MARAPQFDFDDFLTALGCGRCDALEVNDRLILDEVLGERMEAKSSEPAIDPTVVAGNKEVRKEVH